MSKKKLIDAETFSERLKNLSQNLYIPSAISASPYSEDPTAQAIYEQMDMLHMHINDRIDDAARLILSEISFIVDDCTYQDHPCLLCKDSEDIASQVEDFGDWREAQKIANPK